MFISHKKAMSCCRRLGRKVLKWHNTTSKTGYAIAIAHLTKYLLEITLAIRTSANWLD